MSARISFPGSQMRQANSFSPSLLAGSSQRPMSNEAVEADFLLARSFLIPRDEIGSSWVDSSDDSSITRSTLFCFAVFPVTDDLSFLVPAIDLLANLLDFDGVKVANFRFLVWCQSNHHLQKQSTCVPWSLLWHWTPWWAFLEIEY